MTRKSAADVLAEQTMRINLRERRAHMVAAAVSSAITPFLPPDVRYDRVMHAIIEVLVSEGIDILTDEDRRQASLPPRGPDGWTAQELHALEAARLEALARPIFVPMPDGKVQTLPADDTRPCDTEAG